MGHVKFERVPAPPALPPSLLTDPRTRAAYAEGAGIYRIVPAAVAIPRDLPELQALVHWASQTDTPLVPRGAGSGIAGGSVGRGVVVDLGAFGGVALDATKRIARAGAAVTCAAVNDAARDAGLRLPPDPSSCSFATSGGMVATNAAGPRSLRYGSVRRWIESIEIVTADGAARAIRRGAGSRELFPLTPDTRHLISQRFPKTRKNSSGYALDAFMDSGDELDLLIGSEGTLAFITAVEWRLDPIPAAVAGAAMGLADLDALGEAVSYLLTLDPSTIELLDRTLLDFVASVGGGVAVPPATGCLLLVEFERGSQAAARGLVGDAVRGLRSLSTHVDTAIDRAGLEQLWAVRRLASPALARLPESRRSLQVIEDGCVPVAQLGGYVRGVREAAGRHGIPVAIFGHAGDGHVHVNALPDTSTPGWRESLRSLFDEVTTLLERCHGTPSSELATSTGSRTTL